MQINIFFLFQWSVFITLFCLHKDACEIYQENEIDANNNTGNHAI